MWAFFRDVVRNLGPVWEEYGLGRRFRPFSGPLDAREGGNGGKRDSKARVGLFLRSRDPFGAMSARVGVELQM